MMKKFVLFLLFFSSVHHKHAQRLSTGFIAGVVANQHIALPNNYLYPQNSYFIYYTGNEKKDGKPIFNKPFSGFLAGFTINIDYKRFTLVTELNGALTNITLPAYYPSGLGSIIGGNWSNFKTKKSSFLINTLLNYKITNKANGPFLQLGGQFSFNKHKEVRGTIDTEISDAVWLFISDYEMYGITYTNKQSWFNVVAGLGFKINDHFYTLRYSQRIFGNKEEYPIAQFNQLELLYSRVLNFQKLRKGYKIYLD
jgi:hypothetical protein